MSSLMPPVERLPSGSAPLKDILQAAAREIARLGEDASSLQDALSPLQPGLSAPATDQLQMLDIFTQKLNGIAEFVAVLTTQVSPAWMCDAEAAAEALTLSDLAALLSCRVAPGSSMEDKGALHLF